MIFNKHFDLEGKHAFLSASNNAWVNYDEDKLARVYANAQAAKRGTEMHLLARDLIRLGVKLPDSGQTLNMYVNDAIGFKLVPEQPLVYTDNCFGTPDAIGFRKNTLRIHDLKTGFNEAKITQLEVYAALFCLEYRYKPFDIVTEMRIYQNDSVEAFIADPDVIFHIIDRIVTFDKLINDIKKEVAL